MSENYVDKFIMDGQEISVRDNLAREQIIDTNADIGRLSDLQTPNKDTLVDAINDAYTGGQGVSDYNDLTNKPSINGHTLQNDMSASDLGIETFNGEYNSLNDRPVEADDINMSDVVYPLPSQRTAGLGIEVNTGSLNETNNVNVEVIVERI